MSRLKRSVKKGRFVMYLSVILERFGAERLQCGIGLRHGSCGTTGIGLRHGIGMISGNGRYGTVAIRN